MILYDFFIAVASYFLALWLRFDCQYSSIPDDLLLSYLYFIPIYSVLTLFVFAVLRLYNSIWRFANYSELTRVIVATGILCFSHVLLTVLCGMLVPSIGIRRMPVFYYAVGIVIQFLFTVFIRFFYRFFLMIRNAYVKSEENVARIMLVGAGAAGHLVLHNLNAAKDLNERVFCIIDDDPNKWDRYIDGVPIVGGRDNILSAAQEYRIDKIFIAIPSASVQERRDIINICGETGCELKTLPDVYRLMAGKIQVLSAMSEVSMEDLLGRKPVKVDMDEIFAFLKDKTILVTGGGGSIGSELCRQIAAHHPKQLIIFDVYENSVYDLETELRRKYPSLNLVTLIGSVRDSVRIAQVFSRYRPQVVYHAAAHKHVPLMETSPSEAIKNNVFGTYKTAYAAMLYGCERFLLISTDKAVNPTNIMGASKRMCEMVIQSFAQMVRDHREKEIPPLMSHGNTPVPPELRMPEDFRASTDFVAVRFGNVLGSNGSVVPLFKKQIESGGPVTVTHPDIVRYFMTIPEAVSLVLQAGTYAESGTLYVLDMGDEVRIDSLARNLIKLSGLKPDVDIKIQYTGLRPGEKLYEEKLMEEEGLRTTPNKLILIGRPIPFDIDHFFSQLQELSNVSLDNLDVKRVVATIVPTYHSPEIAPLEVGKESASAENF